MSKLYLAPVNEALELILTQLLRIGHAESRVRMEPKVPLCSVPG